MKLKDNVINDLNKWTHIKTSNLIEKYSVHQPLIVNIYITNYKRKSVPKKRENFQINQVASHFNVIVISSYQPSVEFPWNRQARSKFPCAFELDAGWVRTIRENYRIILRKRWNALNVEKVPTNSVIHTHTQMAPNISTIVLVKLQTKKPNNGNE